MLSSQQAARVVIGVPLAWAFAAVITALLTAALAPGFVRAYAYWTLGGVLTAALLHWVMPAARLDYLALLALGWALTGPLVWRPWIRPFRLVELFPRFFDVTFFYPAGVVAGAVIAGLALARATSHEARPWLAAGGWVVGHLLYGVATGYNLPFLLTRPPLPGGLIHALFFGGCGALGMVWALAPVSAIRAGEPGRYRVLFERLRPEGGIPLWACGLPGGLISLGSIGLHYAYTNGGPSNLVAATLARYMPGGSMPLLIALLPAALAAVFAAIAANTAPDRDMRALLSIADVQPGQVAGAVTLAVLYRLRVALAVTFGLLVLPVLFAWWNPFTFGVGRQRLPNPIFVNQMLPTTWLLPVMLGTFGVVILAVVVAANVVLRHDRRALPAGVGAGLVAALIPLLLFVTVDLAEPQAVLGLVAFAAFPYLAAFGAAGASGSISPGG